MSDFASGKPVAGNHAWSDSAAWHRGWVSPTGPCITLKVTLANQRLLNFLHAVRLQVDASPTLMAYDRTRPRRRSMPVV